jgi:hypothetical protein
VSLILLSSYPPSLPSPLPFPLPHTHRWLILFRVYRMAQQLEQFKAAAKADKEEAEVKDKDK